MDDGNRCGAASPAGVAEDCNGPTADSGSTQTAGAAGSNPGRALLTELAKVPKESELNVIRRG